MVKLTESAAASLLGVSAPALNTIRKRGGGPPFYEGRLPGVVGAHRGYYLKHEVLKWAKERRWSPHATSLKIKQRKGRK